MLDKSFFWLSSTNSVFLLNCITHMWRELHHICFLTTKSATVIKLWFHISFEKMRRLVTNFNVSHFTSQHKRLHMHGFRHIVSYTFFWYTVHCTLMAKHAVCSVIKWLIAPWLCSTSSRFKAYLSFLLCPWVRHFMAFSSAWRSWPAVLNFSHISKKLKNK